MNEFSKFSLDITPDWSVISQIKKQIRASLKGDSQELIDKVEIITSELLENAIKYGVGNSFSSQVNFQFQVDESMILINAKNGISNPESLNDFEKIMKEIKSSSSIQSLYVKRLKELLESPGDFNSKIGLYRIASQSGIRKFDYSILNGNLEIRIEIDRKKK